MTYLVNASVHGRKAPLADLVVDGKGADDSIARPRPLRRRRRGRGRYGRHAVRMLQPLALPSVLLWRALLVFPSPRDHYQLSCGYRVEVISFCMYTTSRGWSRGWRRRRRRGREKKKKRREEDAVEEIEEVEGVRPSGGRVRQLSSRCRRGCVCVKGLYRTNRQAADSLRLSSGFCSRPVGTVP